MPHHHSTINWQPTIGDPSFMGWLTVVLYFCTAVCALSVWYRARADQSLTHGRAWLCLGLLLLLLGINKQLDIQTLFTEIGRWLAHKYDWYDQRKTVQRRFIQVIAVLGGLAIVIAGVMVRGKLRTCAVALVGFSFLVSFVLIRATSFHLMDILINVRVLGLRLNWVLEWAGLLLILANGAVLLWWQTKHRAQAL